MASPLDASSALAPHQSSMIDIGASVHDSSFFGGGNSALLGASRSSVIEVTRSKSARYSSHTGMTTAPVYPSCIQK